jgi:acyl-CoA dehydrogenase
LNKTYNDAVICAIALNEERYIDEWIQYNLFLGFSHIYIYDNSSNNVLKNKKSGITLALIQNDEQGLIQNTYHNPNNAGFPNGTIKGIVFINPEQVIGGTDMIGNGWKMLMECLAVGRGVSLPATANGSSKFITQSILNYINIRKQFNMKIGDMEAVREKFIEMYMNTWIIHTSVKLTNHILDSGSTPSVLTAIMKQQTTERARIVLNHGMDIYSGSGICVGENNFFTNFYNSSPVGITVEGSNTLTRGLIIFGQGLNKSHPFIFPIFTSIQENNLDSFKFNFNELLFELLINYVSIFAPTFNLNNINIERLDIATNKFSILTNFVALLGGKIKSNQMISGNMADILSNIYLGYSLIWYHTHYMDTKTDILRDQCLDYLMNEVDYKMNIIINNYPNKLLKPFLYPLKNKMIYSNFENKNKLYKFINDNEDLYNIFKNDIYYEGTVLEKMEKLKLLKPESCDYEKLYQDIIKVGEIYK